MPQIRDYKAKEISFSYDFVLDGGAIGALPTGAFIHDRWVMGFITTTVETGLVGVGASIEVSLEPSGVVVASFLFLPVVVDTIITTATNYVRSQVTEELTVNIVGAPVTAGQFEFYASLIPLDQ